MSDPTQLPIRVVAHGYRDNPTTDWPRWIRRILFSGPVYPLWGPLALWLNKRRNAAR